MQDLFPEAVGQLRAASMSLSGPSASLFWCCSLQWGQPGTALGLLGHIYS